MAHIRCTARNSVIPVLPSRLAERPLHRTVPGQSSHLERLHRRLHEEQEHRRQEQEQEQEQEQQDSSPLPQQEVESGRQPSPTPQPEMPLHHHKASRLLEETLTETETTTTPVAVRATTRSSRRTRSWRDGSLDPSLATPLAGVTSTTPSTPCCIGPSTDTLGLSSTVV
jgi:TolA-binding protein